MTVWTRSVAIWGRWVDYLGWAERWRRAGANSSAAAAGIGPEHIEALASRLR